jgi:hypothetical protein
MLFPTHEIEVECKRDAGVLRRGRRTTQRCRGLVAAATPRVLLLLGAISSCSCGQLLGLDEFREGPAPVPVAVCLPNEVRECPYAGPPSTKGVGACKTATQVCNAEGTMLTACAGEVLPLVEDCATADDDDCDGVPNQVSAGCICEPGASEPCYEGAEGTEGVGSCKPGMRVCGVKGKGFGVCAGQVVPAATDDCSNDIDEDCSGTYCAQTIWAIDVAESGSQAPWGATSDAVGNSYVAGFFNGTLEFGAPSLSSAKPGMYVAKLDPTGKVLWARQSGGTAQFASLFGGVAVDSVGNVVVAGSLSGIFSFGPHTLGSAQGKFDGFVVKYDSAGNVLWAKGFGDAVGQASANQNATGVAIDAAGDVVVTGNFTTSIDLGTGPLSASSSSDIFIAKYDKDGTVQYVKTYVGPAFGHGVAADAFGNAVVTGTFGGSVDFGSGFSLSATTSQDPYVLRVDSSGKTSFARSFGNGLEMTVDAAKFDSLGSVVLSGGFKGTASFAGKSLTVPHAGKNGFVAAFDSSGFGKWAVQIGSSFAPSAGETRVLSLAVDDKDQLWVAGMCAGAVDVGASLDCGDGSISHPYFISMDAMGKPIWGKAILAGAGAITTASYATPAFGILAGTNLGALDLGTGPLTSTNGYDLFVAKIAVR